MGLFRRYLRTELKRMMKNNVRLLAVGDLERLPHDVQQGLVADMAATQNNTGLTVILALSYGAREEIVAATRALAIAVREDRLDPQEIDEHLFAQHLWSADIPDPDLLIRTGGEFRLSNFLLWQLAYTELYITDTLWPDFGREEFLRALTDYQSRERRFGRVEEHLTKVEIRETGGESREMRDKGRESRIQGRVTLHTGL
jgi:undecaprenyl diphosphate synthase